MSDPNRFTVYLPTNFFICVFVFTFYMRSHIHFYTSPLLSSLLSSHFFLFLIRKQQILSSICHSLASCSNKRNRWSLTFQSPNPVDILKERETIYFYIHTIAHNVLRRVSFSFSFLYSSGFHVFFHIDKQKFFPLRFI